MLGVLEHRRQGKSICWSPYPSQLHGLLCVAQRVDSVELVVKLEITHARGIVGGLRSSRFFVSFLGGFRNEMLF